MLRCCAAIQRGPRSGDLMKLTIFGGPKDLPLTSGTANILTAMRTHGVRRLVYSWG